MLLHQGKSLPYRPFARHELPPRIADDKTVDAHIEQAKRRQASPYKPPAHHPWKRPITPQAATQARAALSSAPSTTTT
ncbi:hypothetical protein ACQUFY_24950 (plasmid) [Robbsia andropogonis]|uniref:hypothetical protein n=1 Tax=Robbsia andropogonis TaxID=28092 RepID=UPI003D25BE22